MMVLKIGIITLPGNFNYGNRLQNYALQETIKRMGFEVETIVPLPAEKTFFNYTFEFLGLIKSLLFLNYSTRKNNLKRIELMKKSKEKKLQPFTKKYINNYYLKNNDIESMRKLNNRYDYFVIGSDQVWNPYYISEYDYYFATFSDKEKRVSYAASFGISKIPDKYLEKYTSYLNGISKISVRESVGIEIVRQCTGKQAEIVLDPTLLLSKKEWLNIPVENSEQKNNKYILVYFLDDDFQKNLEIIEKFSKEKCLELKIIMGNYYSEEYIIPSPSEFIHLINNAEYVFTDSFHAVVFSIIMHTKFLAFERGEMNSRISTLLKTTHLEENYNAIVNGRINLKIDCTDFNEADRILYKEREKSKSILNSFIGK